jgi:16S rRNA processing protein RimM
MQDELVIGRVRTAFGLTGEVKIDLFGGDFEYLQSLETVELRRGEQRFKRRILHARPNGACYVVQFEGVDTPELAKELRNSELLVERSEASPKRDGEYYYADLVGLSVIADGDPMGSIVDILEGSGAVFLEVKTADGMRLVPFGSSFVGDVDIASGTVIVTNREILE